MMWYFCAGGAAEETVGPSEGSTQPGCCFSRLPPVTAGSLVVVSLCESCASVGPRWYCVVFCTTAGRDYLLILFLSFSRRSHGSRNRLWQHAVHGQRRKQSAPRQISQQAAPRGRGASGVGGTPAQKKKRMYVDDALGRGAFPTIFAFNPKRVRVKALAKAIACRTRRETKFGKL